MFDRRLMALGALAGVAFAVLEIGGVVVGGIANPAPYDVFPSAASAARFAATPMPAGVWFGFGLELLSTLFLIAFVVRAVAASRGADENNLISTTVLVGGIISVAATFVSFGVMAARDAGAGHGLDAQGVITLSYLNWGTYFLSWPSTAVFLGCLSVAGLRTNSLPVWLGWIGIVVAIAQLAGCLDPVNLGQLAQLPQYLYIPAVGIALAIRRPRLETQPSGVMIPA